MTHPEVFGYTVTFTIGLGETLMHPVALYSNADGHLLDKIPSGYRFYVLGRSTMDKVCFLT